MPTTRILVAAEDIGSSLKEQLEALGYEVLLADDPKSLDDALTSENFHALCLGVNLQGVDYGALLEQIACDEQITHAPVILISDSDSSERVTELLEMGAYDYIELPIKPAMLKARMESCLGTRRTLDADELDVRSAIELASDLRQFILPAGYELAETRDFGQLQDVIVSQAQDLCNADGATLYMVEGDKLAFSTIHTRSLNINMGGSDGSPITFPPLPLYDEETGEPNYHNIATRAVLTGERIHVPDVYNDDEFDFSGTLAFDANNNYRTVSCLALPLKDSEGNVLALLQLINAQERRSGKTTPFKLNDQLAAEALAMQAAIAISNYLLIQKEQLLIKFETDVQVGRSVQASFLPKSLPEPDGWEIAAQFHPAREVAGDFYDVIDLNRNMLGLVIADVCDKGVPAALYMALTRSLLRALSMQHYSLSWADALFSDDDAGIDAHRPDLNVAPLKEGLTRTNDYLTGNHIDLTMFATMFYGLLNTRTGLMSYVNCGHNPPYVIDKTGNIIETLRPVAPAVGMMPNMPFTIKKLQLNPGDTLMTFTDGVPESRAPDGSFYSDDRLKEFLTAKPITSVESLVRDLVTDLRTHIDDAVQFDDITMLAVKREM